MVVEIPFRIREEMQLNLCAYHRGIVSYVHLENELKRYEKMRIPVQEFEIAMYQMREEKLK